MVDCDSKPERSGFSLMSGRTLPPPPVNGSNNGKSRITLRAIKLPLRRKCQGWVQNGILK